MKMTTHYLKARTVWTLTAIELAAGAAFTYSGHQFIGGLVIGLCIGAMLSRLLPSNGRMKG